MRTKKFTIGKALLLCGFIFFSAAATAQEFSWAGRIGGSLQQTHGTAVAVDAAGNVYAVGRFGGTADLDPGPGTFMATSTASFPNYNIYITKVDAAGNFIWAKTLDVSSNFLPSATLTSSGQGLLITGTFIQSADMDPGPGIFNLTSDGVGDIFVCQLDLDGNFEWAVKIGGPGWQDAYDIKTDATGNIYICGYFTGSTNFDTGTGSYTLSSANIQSSAAFVCKLNSTGGLVWARHIGNSVGQEAKAHGLAVDTAGNAYITGEFIGTEDFDPGSGTLNLTANGQIGDFVAKFDSTGELVWARTSQDSGHGDFAIGVTLTADANSNVWVAGHFRGNVTYTTSSGSVSISTGANPSTANSHTYLARLDPAGNYTTVFGLVSSLNPTSPSDITVDAEGNIYMTGDYRGTLDFDPGAGEHLLSTSTAFSEPYVLKLSSTGQFIWVKVFRGGSSQINSLSRDQYGGLYLTGIIRGDNIDVDPGQNTYFLSSVDEYIVDAFVAKWGVQPPVGVAEQLEPGAIFSVYPNPASGYIKLQGLEKPANFSITDVLGREVKSGALPENSQLDIATLPEGMYVLRAATGQSAGKTLRFVISR